jgi:hypothetical protein
MDNELDETNSGDAKWAVSGNFIGFPADHKPLGSIFDCEGKTVESVRVLPDEEGVGIRISRFERYKGTTWRACTVQIRFTDGTFCQIYH